MQILCAALSVYSFILLVRIVLSWTQVFGWTPPEALAPVIRVVYDLTEPIMGFLRRYIPSAGGLDLSPIFIFIAIRIAQGLLGC